MKAPRDLADRMGGGQSSANRIVRETRKTPPWEARKPAKRVFEDFPSSTYLPEIESGGVSWGGTLVEGTTKRWEYPVDDKEKQLPRTKRPRRPTGGRSTDFIPTEIQQSKPPHLRN